MAVLLSSSTLPATAPTMAAASPTRWAACGC
jgi:hypothetical protein